jgi:hypothetical protein
VRELFKISIPFDEEEAFALVNDGFVTYYNAKNINK